MAAAQQCLPKPPAGRGPPPQTRCLSGSSPGCCQTLPTKGQSPHCQPCHPAQAHLLEQAVYLFALGRRQTPPIKGSASPNSQPCHPAQTHLLEQAVYLVSHAVKPLLQPALRWAAHKSRDVSAGTGRRGGVNKRYVAAGGMRCVCCHSRRSCLRPVHSCLPAPQCKASATCSSCLQTPPPAHPTATHPQRVHVVKRTSSAAQPS